MSLTTINKREAWLVGAGVVLIALLYRYAWLPIAWEEMLRQAAETWGLPVEDVGRWFSAWATGDGQAFAVIASDPLGLDEGWQLGHPAYRYGRAGFGWLAWVVSLGQARWVPYAMAIVGMAAVVVSFLLALRLRPRLGPSAWLIVLNPAMMIGFAGDTAETLGVLALAWTLASGQLWASAALGVIRPSFLIGLVGRWRHFMCGVTIALIFGALWIVRFGFEASQYGGALEFPLVGYIGAPSIHSVALGVFALFTLLMGIRHKDWGWTASGLFVLCFSAQVVELAANGWRAAGMLFVLWAFGPGYKAPVPGGGSVASKFISALETPRGHSGCT